MTLAAIDEAVAEIRNGRMIIIIDDEDREEAKERSRGPVNKTTRAVGR